MPFVVFFSPGRSPVTTAPRAPQEKDTGTRKSFKVRQGIEEEVNLETFGIRALNTKSGDRRRGRGGQGRAAAQRSQQQGQRRQPQASRGGQQRASSARGRDVRDQRSGGRRDGGNRSTQQRGNQRSSQRKKPAAASDGWATVAKKGKGKN